LAIKTCGQVKKKPQQTFSRQQIESTLKTVNSTQRKIELHFLLYAPKEIRIRYLRIKNLFEFAGKIIKD